MSIYMHVYSPYNTLEVVAASRCRYAVPVGRGSVRFRQCARKAKHYVHNYGFCAAHLKKVLPDRDTVETDESLAPYPRWR